MRLARIAVALLVAAGCLSGCSPGPTPDLIFGVSSSADAPLLGGESQGGAPRRYVESPDAWVCGLGPVQLDRVALIRPTSNLRLVDWAVDNTVTRSREDGGPGRLADYPSLIWHSVERPCGRKDGGAYAAVGVEVLRTDDEVARFDGLELDYHSGGVAKAGFLNVEMILCPGKCPDVDD